MKTILSLLLWVLSSALLTAQIPFTAKEGVLAYKNSLSPDFQTRFRFYNGFTESLDPTTGKATQWEYVLFIQKLDEFSRYGDSLLCMRVSRESAGWKFTTIYTGRTMVEGADSALAWIDSDVFVSLPLNDSTQPDNDKAIGTRIGTKLLISATGSNAAVWTFPVALNQICTITSVEKNTNTSFERLYLPDYTLYVYPSVATNILHVDQRDNLLPDHSIIFHQDPQEYWKETPRFKRISIYNMRGQEVLSIVEEQSEYDISSLPSGFYLLRYESTMNEHYATFRICR